MTSTLALQRRLKTLGFDPGPADGVWGPQTIRAVNDALDQLAGAPAPPVATVAAIPADWMPWARMERIIVHWNAGTNKASRIDREHYHIIIEGDGQLVRGDRTIADNESAADGKYAAHTRGLNTGSIGVSLAGMAGARQSPFNAGRYPLTRAQWEMLPKVLADLSVRYAIPVTPQTVLSHAEVEKTLGVSQAGKWDVAALPFDPSMNTATKIGDAFRNATKALL